MKTRVKFFLFSLLLGSCLSASAQERPEPYASLNGNWHLTGEQNNRKSAYLSIAMAVSGNTIYGNGKFHMICPNGAVTAMAIVVRGQIASDGTFLLVNHARGSRLTISGRVPDSGTSTWPGSFTGGFGDEGQGPGSKCPDLSGDFVATLYPPLNGTYAGTLAGTGSDPEIAVSAAIIQGETKSYSPSPHAAPIFYYIPLSATIQLEGLSKPMSLRTRDVPDSRVAGDSLDLRCILEDGSALVLTGRFTDSSGETLYMTLVIRGKGGADAVNVFGTLTRQ